MVTFTGTWTATTALPAGYAVPPPAARSLPCPIANTGQGGNWLIAFAAWRTPPGILTTVAVGDDSWNTSPGVNLWEPLGAPNGTSPLAGNTAVSIWYCRNALPAQNLYVSPNGLVTSVSVRVEEVSGLGPWATLAGVTAGYAGAATAGPSLTVPAPASSALLLTALSSGNSAATVGGPGAGWTALPSLTASNGADHTADCVLNAAWQVTSTAAASAWTSTVAQDLAGVIAGVLVTGDTPVAPSQDWPFMQFQAGFGAGAKTPWDQVAFTDLTPRLQSFSSTRGKQYEQDTIQAGTSAMALSNNDAALTEGYTGSPFYPGVQVYAPFRLLATWPPPPAQNARTYPVSRGFVERWPQSLTAARYQVANTQGTDVYAMLTPQMRSLAQSEVITDNPYAYWPLNDQAGAGSAANLARGNSQQLQVAEAKYGSGGAVADFNASLQALAGDPGCTGWQQQSVPAAAVQGWCLFYQDTSLPAISGGVTLEGWFALNVSQPTGLSQVLISARNSAGAFIQVRVSATQQLVLDVWDRVSRAQSTTVITSVNMLTGIAYHVAVAFTPTGWTCYVNGGAIATAAGSCNLANTGWWACFGGVADRTASSGFGNVTIAHLAVFGYVVSQSRVISHYYAAVAGMAGEDTSGPRADRLLGDANCAYPRLMPAGAGMCAGATDIAAQAVSQNIVNVSQSDSSWLMVTAGGYLAQQSRRQGYDLPVMWTFGELQAEPLNANSAFNGTAASWTAIDGATGAYSTTWQYGQGAGSLLVTPGAGASPGAESEMVPVTPGVTYTGSVWLLSPQGWAAGVSAAVLWYDSSATLLGEAAGPVPALPAGSPLLVQASGRAPAGAAFAVLLFFATGTPGSLIQFYAGYAALTAPGEYAYLGDVATDCDPSQLYDDITLTQLAAPEASQTTIVAAAPPGSLTLTVANAAAIAADGVIILAPATGTAEAVTVTSVSGTTVGVTATAFTHAAGTTVSTVNASASGVTITAVVQANIDSFGDTTYQETSYLADPAAITDQAQWIANTTGPPQNRISGMTLDPAANPALWPVVLGLETGQVAQVNRRLQGTLMQMSGLYQVMSIAHTESPGKWQTKVVLVPYPGQVLACDDTTRGIPGTVNTLGWLRNGHGTHFCEKSGWSPQTPASEVIVRQGQFAPSTLP